MLKTIQWTSSAVRLIDQTRLPLEVAYVDITTPAAMHDAVKRLVVRGAPAIGIAAAFGVFLGIRNSSAASIHADLEQVCVYLATARPTAVNLFWAIKRIRKVAEAELAGGATPDRVRHRVLVECQAMLEEDIAICRAIGERGLELFAGKSGIINLMTHCNAGGLATAQFGTALAPIYIGQEKGLKFHVFVDETRPLLQGARITAMELMANGVDCTLVCDNMAAAVMSSHKIDGIIVGTDRVAANGDVANKIGTHNLAIVAKRFGVPFYVAAPISSIDAALAEGSQIPIEQRDAGEITQGFGRRTAPEGVKCFNPAFDVTPADLVDALITEKGILRPPYRQAIASIM